eukprot:tig00000692_g3210.t1
MGRGRKPKKKKPRRGPGPGSDPAADADEPPDGPPAPVAAPGVAEWAAAPMDIEAAPSPASAPSAASVAAAPVRRCGRNLTRATARQLLAGGHGEFRRRLEEAARHGECEVHLVLEHYTSKTCGNCGRLNDRLRGSKTFHCPHCGVVMDRDWNGAR